MSSLIVNSVESLIMILNPLIFFSARILKVERITYLKCQTLEPVSILRIDLIETQMMDL